MEKYDELKLMELEFVNGEKHKIGEYFATLRYHAKMGLSKYQFRAVTCDELIYIGAQGLVRASYTFDPERGNSFTTYAQYYVENEINSFLKKDVNVLNNSITDTPKLLTNEKYKINTAKFEQEYSREPNSAELLEYSGLNRGNDFDSFNNVCVMDGVGKEEEEDNKFEFIDEDNNPKEEYEQNERLEAIKRKNDEIRSILTEKENKYIEYKKVENLTDAEISRRLKISPSMVSTMYIKILRKIALSKIKSLNLY